MLIARFVTKGRQGTPTGSQSFRLNKFNLLHGYVVLLTYMKHRVKFIY
jgi:hypothetical protein